MSLVTFSHSRCTSRHAPATSSTQPVLLFIFSFSLLLHDSFVSHRSLSCTVRVSIVQHLSLRLLLEDESRWARCYTCTLNHITCHHEVVLVVRLPHLFFFFIFLFSLFVQTKQISSRKRIRVFSIVLCQTLPTLHTYHAVQAPTQSHVAVSASLTSSSGPCRISLTPSPVFFTFQAIILIPLILRTFNVGIYAAMIGGLATHHHSATSPSRFLPTLFHIHA